MGKTIRAWIWLFEDDTERLWDAVFKIVDELPYKDMDELEPYSYVTPDYDGNSYRFFMKKTEGDDAVLVAIPEGELQTFEDGEQEAREQWESYEDRDEDDFRVFSARANLPGYNDDVVHSSDYYDGYKSEVLKIAKETGYTVPWVK